MTSEAPQKAKPEFVPKISITKETTFVTEPVAPSGFIDYVAAINRKCSVGVTPDNNAVVGLYAAFGPAPENTPQPDEFFKLLGITRPPEKGDYFEDLERWTERTSPTKSKRALTALLKNYETAQSRVWTADEFPEIERWLQANEVPVKQALEATERSEYFYPSVSSDGSEGAVIRIQLSGVAQSRLLSRVLRARAMRCLGAGGQTQAVANLIGIHRLGRLVGRGHSLMEGHVAIGIENVALEGELILLAQMHQDLNVLAEFRRQLERLPPLSPFAEKLDFGGRLMQLDCCQQFARGRLDDMNFGKGFDGWANRTTFEQINWNFVLQRSNLWFDRLSQASRLPTYRERVEACEELEREINKIGPRPKTPTLNELMTDKNAFTKYAARILTSLLCPAFSSGMKNESVLVQQNRNFRVTLALIQWRSEHDSYPETLGELTPKYLADLPLDWFNEQPLHYTRIADGFQIHSVGPNEINDQGKTAEQEPGADDLVVRILAANPIPGP